MNEIIIDTARYIVTANGQQVALSPKEFDILTALKRAGGAVLSRSELFAKVWGADYYPDGYDTSTRVIDQHIKRLRFKLGPARSAIITVPARGYRLEG